jgi:hypothetical protein
VDPEASPIQPNEAPEITLDRTRQLIARSRLTLAAVERRLGSDEDEEQTARRQSRES